MSSAAAPAAALDVRFGSSLHTVYRSPAGPSSSIVVAPSLLGSELNATNFHDIRTELEKVWQREHSDPDWSFGTKVGHNGVVKVPCRDLLHPTGSAVNDAFHRICEYYSINRGTAGVGALYRKGCPRILYSSDDPHVPVCSREVRNVTAIAFFGSTGTLSLRRRGCAAASIQMSLTTNSVVAIGADALRHGWEYGVQPFAASSSATSATRTPPELITLLVRGTSSAFADRSPPDCTPPPSCSSALLLVPPPPPPPSLLLPAASEVSSHGSEASDGSSQCRSHFRGQNKRRGVGSAGGYDNSSSFSASSTMCSDSFVDDDRTKRRRSRY
jgi:hypothetical protein